MSMTKAQRAEATRKMRATRASNKAALAFAAYAAQATPDQRLEAETWYPQAQDAARRVTKILRQNGCPTADIRLGAAVIAAFSPREKWSSNMVKAGAFAAGEEVKGLGANKRTAQRARDYAMAKQNPLDALGGKKTSAFARNIAGDHNAVTLDVWMARAAGIPQASFSRKYMYERVSDAVASVAREYGVAPATMQALIWIVVRGTSA